MVDQLQDKKTHNYYRKTIVTAGIAILLSSHLSAEISVSANLLLGRAFSANIVREMLMTGSINKQSEHNISGCFAIDGAYQRSWQQSETQGIGAYPFWSETNSMTIGDKSGNYNVDAYQFGLGPVNPTNTTIALNPLIYQTGADFMFFVKSKQYGHSIFAKIKSALSAMVVNPGLTETDPVTPQSYPAGALEDVSTTGTTPATSTNMIQAFAGNTGTQSVQGDLRPMTNGLINGIQSTGAHLSDTEMTVGYNYTCSETDNTGSLGLRVTAPTGTKPEGVYILEPVNGRGGYWGVGAYLAATYRVWQSKNERHSVKLNFMSSGIHLCNATVMRSYDLTANGYGSKYLLVADYKDGVYQNSIQNLVNLSTLESQSSFPFEGDAALSVIINSGNFSAEVGYNAWGRMAENLTITESFDAQRYAVLGRQDVGANNAGTEVPSTLCQPTATINSSAPAQGGIGNAGVNTGLGVLDATIAANRISGSDAFNTTITAQYAAATSKAFAKVGYNWKDNDYNPYLNLVGECEWSNISNNAIPQWGISLMGGISL